MRRSSRRRSRPVPLETGWLDPAGTDPIDPGPDDRCSRPARRRRRAARLPIGFYYERDDPDSIGWPPPRRDRGYDDTLDLPAGDLHLVNDDDLTFAAVRPDDASLGRCSASQAPFRFSLAGRRGHHGLGHARARASCI